MKDFQGQTDSHVGIDIFPWTLAELPKRAESGHHLGEGLLPTYLLNISSLPIVSATPYGPIFEFVAIATRATSQLAMYNRQSRTQVLLGASAGDLE